MNHPEAAHQARASLIRSGHTAELADIASEDPSEQFTYLRTLATELDLTDPEELAGAFLIRAASPNPDQMDLFS